MRNRLTHLAAPSAAFRACPLRLEALEAREVPAVLIQLDFSRDTGFFANNPAAQAVVQQAATELGNSISSDLAAIAPAGGNTWTASFTDPATGALINLANPTIGANAIKVFVGARLLGGGESGYATTGGAGYSGSPDWVSAVGSRGHTGYSPWGGSIAFDTNTNWYFGQTISGIRPGQLDFYSVALHEMGHVLGIGTSPQWAANLSGSSFVGSNAQAVYGGPVPTGADRDHWADGVTVGGQRAAMDPVLTTGTRVGWSALDAAALRDVGWAVSATPAAPPAAPAAPARPAFVGLEPGTPLRPVALTGSDDGTATLYITANGALTSTGQTLTPFPGYKGAIRVASGDFNGDSVTDYAFATGAGPQSVVEIVNGRDGTLLVGQTAIFPGFSGGLFVAAADIDRDGRADLVVSADAGAGPHIQTFRVVNGGLQQQSSFFAFDNPAYRGGARVAVGDLNRDGFADVVVTTGGQAEGRVAIYSGASLRNGVATRLAPDFNPFAGFWGGVNAAVGDMNGDGYAELAVAPDAGGPAHVQVWSGAMLSTNPAVPANRLARYASFFAFPPQEGTGARLAIRDTDGNGRAELIVGSGAPHDGGARAFAFEQLNTPWAAPELNPLGAAVNGIYVG